jgi:hypothetical protein
MRGVIMFDNEGVIMFDRDLETVEDLMDLVDIIDPHPTRESDREAPYDPLGDYLTYDPSIIS